MTDSDFLIEDQAKTDIDLAQNEEKSVPINFDTEEKITTQTSFLNELENTLMTTYAFQIGQRNNNKIFD